MSDVIAKALNSLSKGGTDYGLYEKKNNDGSFSNTSRVTDKVKANQHIYADIAPTLANSTNQAGYASWMKPNNNVSFGSQIFDGDAFEKARSNFMDWMTGSGSTGKYGYNLNDAEDMERLNNRQISKKYEASYSNSPFDQWLKANGQASSGYFADKYYNKAYASVLADRAEEQAVRNFKKAVAQEAWSTAIDPEHITGDDVAAAAQRVQLSNPQFANISIANPKTNTDYDYSNYTSPVLAEQEAARKDAEKRASSLYLDDVLSEVETYQVSSKRRNEAAAKAAQTVAETKADKAQSIIDTAIANNGFSSEIDNRIGLAKDSTLNEWNANRAKKSPAATEAVAALREAGYSNSDIKRAIRQDGRLSYTEDSEQGVEEEKIRVQRRDASDGITSNVLSEEAPIVQASVAKAKALANMGTAAQEGFSPISMMEGFAMSEEETAYTQKYVADTRLTLEQSGYGGLEIDNALRRADLGEYIPPETSRSNYAIYTLGEMGLTDQQIQNELSTYTEDDWANIDHDMLASDYVENSATDQIGKSLLAVPVRAALSIVSSAVGFADMATAGVQGRNAAWEVTDNLTEIANWWAGYSHDRNHEIISEAADVGSEILRMYATSLVGTGLAAASTKALGASKGTSYLFQFLSKNSGRLPFIANSMGSYYNEAIAEGANTNDATWYAIPAGLLEGYLESLEMGQVLQNTIGTNFIGKKIAASGLSTSFKQLAITEGMPWINFCLSVLGEGVEEGLSAIGSSIMRTSTWDENHKLELSDVWGDAKGGLIIGAVMGGLSMGANTQSYKYASEMYKATDGNYTAYIDSLQSAMYMENLTDTQRTALIQKYANNEITPDAEAYAEAEAEMQNLNATTAAKKKAVEAAEEDAAIKIDAAQAEVEEAERRLANLEEANPVKRAKAVQERARQLSGKKKNLAQVQSESTKKVETATAEYQAVASKAKKAAAKNQQTIEAYHTAKYVTDIQNAAEAPVSVSDVDMNTNTNEGANTAENSINKAADDNVQDTAQVDVRDTVPPLKDLGANTPTPVEMAQSKVYTNTYDKWLDEAEKKADNTANAWYARSKEVDTLANANSIVQGTIRRYGNLDTEMVHLQDKTAWDATDVDTAMLIAETLRSEAAETGEYGKLNDWKNVIRQNMTQSGQAIQALAKWTRNSSIAAETAIDKALADINKKYEKQIETGRATAVTVDPELMAELNAAQTPEQREEIIGRITADIGAKMPVSLAEKINSWRYLAMLGNPRTIIRNLIGNEIMSDGLWTAKDAFGTLLEKGIDQSKRTKAIMLGDDYKANRAYAESTLSEAKNKLEGSSRYDSKSGIKKAIEDNRKIFNFAPVEMARKATDWALSEGDTVFLEKQYKRSFAQIMTARGYNPETITEKQKRECMSYAIAEAQRSTFHDASKIADAMQKLEDSSKAAKLLVGGIMPFKKTPLNVLARGVDFSPIGLIQGTTQMLGKVRKGEMSAAEAIDKMSSGLTGSSLMLMGYFLAKSGVLMGGNNDEDKYYTSDLGRQEFALNLGDGKSMTIDWAAPAVIPLFMGAALNDIIAREGEDDENSIDTIMNTFSGITDPLIEMSMLQGLQDTLESAANASTNNESAIWAMAKTASMSYATSFVPTIGGQLARTIDPVRRNTAGDPSAAIGKEADKVLNKTKAKLPGVANTLEPYINVWGEQEINEHSWPVRLIEQSILPGYLDKTDMTPVDVEITRLYSETQNPKVVPSNYPYRTLKNGKTGDIYVLSDSEYTDFKIENGRAMYAAALDAINSSRYSLMDDDEKASYVADAIEDAQDSVLNKYKKKYVNN